MTELGRPHRSRRVAALAIVLAATAIPLAGQRVSAGEPEPPSAHNVDLSHDMAPIQIAEVPPDAVPPGLVSIDHRAAASVEPIQPGQGFSVFASVPNFGAYRFQLVDGTPEVVRGWMQSVANQLTTLTHIGFSVDPGFVARPANYASNLFATPPSDPSTWGIIRVLVANESPCGSLAEPLLLLFPWRVGCGGPDAVTSGGAPVAFVRGDIWLSPGLTAPGREALQAETAAHESGLAHFDTNYEGMKQLMHSSVTDPPPVPGRCGTRYRSGDRNGVWYLHNDFAWLVTAQYRDFLGRIPDRAGYEHWLRSGVDAGQLAASLSNSDEWVGHVVDELYVGFRGGPPDPAGRAYWSGLLRQLGVPAVASLMYASDEYFNNHGANIDSWIAALYHDLLGAGRVPNAADLDYWRTITVQYGRPTTAMAIYQSLENRRSRVDRLYAQLLDRGSDEAGRAYWAEQILQFGDLSLAVFLASSTEYRQQADEFALSGTTCA
jgi:hypothetical protein